MSRVLPILFNTDMVRAILDGRKTVTRRVIKPQPKAKIAYRCAGYGCGKWSHPGKDAWKYWDDESFRLPEDLSDAELSKMWTPPCHTGDILYVRETWDSMVGISYGDLSADTVYFYKAEGDFRPAAQRGKWRPSIRMPKEAARIWLKVTDVRVERLQDITAEDVVKEGTTGFDMEHIADLEEHFDIPFAALWDSTIKKSDLDRYGWDANPWVWVIEFERCEKLESEG